MFNQHIRPRMQILNDFSNIFQYNPPEEHAYVKTSSTIG